MRKTGFIFSKRGNSFIQRSIIGALDFLKESVFADEYALKKGLLQSFDPRVKTATFLLLITQVLLTRNMAVLLALYVFCLLLSSLSFIRIGFFLKRTWVFIPIFSLFIALPALFNIFTPGEPLVSWKIAGVCLSITRQGLSGAELFVTRVATSVSFVVLLSLTTRHFELLRVLRIFKVPQIFVMTAGMCYRYIYLFVEMIENTYLAIKSRVGHAVHYKRGQHIVAWNIAYLWTRSYQLNQQVYSAMLSRGYNGEARAMSDFRVRLRDRLWLVFTVLVALAAFYYNHRINK